jgi:hypothetical protein
MTLLCLCYVQSSANYEQNKNLKFAEKMTQKTTQKTTETFIDFLPDPFNTSFNDASVSGEWSNNGHNGANVINKYRFTPQNVNSIVFYLITILNNSIHNLYSDDPTLLMVDDVSTVVGDKVGAGGEKWENGTKKKPKSKMSLFSLLSTLPLIDLFHYYLSLISPTSAIQFNTAIRASQTIQGSPKNSPTTTTTTTPTPLSCSPDPTQFYPHPHLSIGVLPTQYIDIINNAVNYPQLFQNRKLTSIIPFSCSQSYLSSFSQATEGHSSHTLPQYHSPLTDCNSSNRTIQPTAAPCLHDSYQSLSSVKAICHSVMSSLLRATLDLPLLQSSLYKIIGFFLTKQLNDRDNFSFDPVYDTVLESQCISFSSVGGGVGGSDGNGENNETSGGNIGNELVGENTDPGLELDVLSLYCIYAVIMKM